MNALVEWVIQWLTYKYSQLIPEWINGFELLVEWAICWLMKSATYF